MKTHTEFTQQPGWRPTARRPGQLRAGAVIIAALTLSGCAGAPLPAGYDPDQRETCIVSYTHACGTVECLATGKRYAWAAMQELEQ